MANTGKDILHQRYKAHGKTGSEMSMKAVHRVGWLDGCYGNMSKSYSLLLCFTIRLRGYFRRLSGKSQKDGGFTNYPLIAGMWHSVYAFG